MPEPSESERAAAELGPAHQAQVLPLLIIGQIALHAAMAGQRMAAPLQALQAGHSACRCRCFLLP